MHHIVLPALFALFVWWFSTGLVIYLDGLHPRTFRWSMAGATLLLGVALVGIARSAWDTTLGGAYAAFACAMLAWAWQEISFYTGYVTGPRPLPSPEGSRGWRHFGYALGCSLYHEIAVIVTATAVVGLTWGAPNQIGTWTFLVLWWMHESARVNVFLGVANLNEKFLPEHMRFLSSFMTKRPMNLLFPVSVTVSTAAAALLARQVFEAGVSQSEAAGFVFLATMMAVAILEHWFLVVPLPSEALWEWGLKSRRNPGRIDLEQLALAEVEVTTCLIERSRT